MLPMLTAFPNGPQAESFGKAPAPKTAADTTTTVAVAVLLALQTHIHVERTAEGE